MLLACFQNTVQKGAKTLFVPVCCGRSMVIGMCGLLASRYSYVDASKERQPRFFGHVEAHSKGNFAEPDEAFDPSLVKTGDVVAIVMHHEDAKVWGRMFDIALVVGERWGKGKAKRKLEVTYYRSLKQAEGAEEDVTQEDQILGLWALQTPEQRGLVLEENILCACWLEDAGSSKGSLMHPDYIDRLRSELSRHQDVEL